METAEQVIEEMMQGGYLICKVLVFHPHMCIGGGWIPLEETDPLPDRGTWETFEGTRILNEAVVLWKFIEEKR